MCTLGCIAKVGLIHHKAQKQMFRMAQQVGKRIKLWSQNDNRLPLMCDFIIRIMRLVPNVINWIGAVD